MRSPRLSALYAVALVAGCTSAPESRAAELDSDAPRLAAAEAKALPASSLPNELSTEPLDPAPVCVRIEDLPPPGASADVGKNPRIEREPEGAKLQVPEGFAVQLFAESLDEPRWPALDPRGDVLVTETRKNRITRLIDANRDGVAERREVFASEANGLELPFGMAFAEVEGETRFFLGNHDEVRSYPYAGDGPLEGRGERIARLPGGGYRQHWTRNVVVAPSGDALFVSVGSESNHGIEPLPRASIQTMRLDGSQMRTFAHGLRNPVGLAFQPRTGALYATVNERDRLGDDLVPDFLAR
ncbi:MAG: sorbosone dehydrogenase family protein, partial [Polyangiaceae bacterium]|nr:sorbosone dehydrogenase family protein [Polyangiaceae bacterium]